MEKEIYGVIYCIKNKVNNKIYFGQTVNDFKTRYGNNVVRNTTNEHLKKCFAKYGIGNFEIDENFDIARSLDELNLLEKMYVIIYDTCNRKYGYNKKFGGGSHGKAHEESKLKQSLKMKGRKVSLKTRLKISKAFTGENHPLYGTKLTDETKKKLSESHKGKVVSEETKKKLSEKLSGKNNPMYGKTHTDEVKNRLREISRITSLGRKHTEETKRKISEANKGNVLPREIIERVAKERSIKFNGEGNPFFGKTHTEETKAKISIASIERNMSNGNPRARKVISLNTLKVFNTAKEAGKSVNREGTSITKCCKGKAIYCGYCVETNENAKWMYHEEYINSKA